jgi:hypothetical protein
MATNYGPSYNSVAEITGPSGWYIINTAAGPCQTYVNQTYDGGGWCLVLANRANTGGFSNLNYVDATTQCNFRGGTSAATNIVVPSGSKLNSLADYNVWVAPLFWPLLASRATSEKITVVQFVAGTNGTTLNGSHTKRYRWRFDSFNSRWGMIGPTAISDETGTGAPGLYSYHAANGYSLTTYDVDQDAYSSNCSTSYGNNPWWYGACWSGNYFGYDGNTPYWDSSGGDTHQYGAIYIK